MNAPERTQISIAVVERDGRYLVGQRAADTALGGMCEFPGGKSLAGESPAAAAVRECREETGIAISVECLLATVDHDYDHGRLRLHFFLCRPEPPDAEPAGSFRWMARSELAPERFPPANAAVLRLLIEGQ